MAHLFLMRLRLLFQKKVQLSLQPKLGNWSHALFRTRRQVYPISPPSCTIINPATLPLIVLTGNVLVHMCTGKQKIVAKAKSRRNNLNLVVIRSLVVVLIVILVILQTFSVFAHGGEARIELNVTQASPGATIDVRGTGFEPLEIVFFALVNSGIRVQIGELEADVNGDFASGLLLPFDLEYGEYELHAADADHSASVPLSIVPDRSGEEDGGPRDQEEPLLGPVPTYAPGVVPGEMPQLTIQPATTTTESASRQSPIAMIVIILLIVGVMVVFGLRVMQKR